MLRRLDSHNRANFTTAEGKQPYFNKYTTPLTKIEYANSVSNVRNTGIDTKWFLDGVNWTSSVFAGRTQFVKFYHGNGVPEVFTKQNMIKNWGVKYTGYFRPPVSANYTFYAGGEGVIHQCKVGNNHCMSGRHLMMSATDYVTSTTLSLVTNTWYPIDIRYQSKYLSGNESGLVMFWKTNNSAVTPEKIVLSAGVITDNTHQPLYASAETIPFKDLPFFSKTSYSESENSIKTLSFTLPLIDSSLSYNAKGYFYSRALDTYIEKSTYTRLQKYRQIRYSEGYRTKYPNNYCASFPSSGTNYIEASYDARMKCSTAFSCEAWVKLTTGGGVIVELPKTTDGTSPFVDWMVYITSGTFGLRMGTEAYETTQTVNDGNWHYLVVTADGSKWKWYIDGVLIKTVNTTGLPTHVSNFNLRIGRDRVASSSLQYKGLLEELRVYGRAITYEEVIKNYNNGIGNYKPYDTADLRLWYHFDEASGTITDWSGLGFTGTITGSIAKTTGKINILDEYIHKFTGNIRDLSIDYSKEGSDVLKVTCYDYGAFTKDNINLVSPTPIDYWQAGYLSKIASRVDGNVKPRAFDGWAIDKAYQVLLTESWIDPYTFYKKYNYVDYNGVATAGPYLIEPINSSVNSYLPTKSNYGRVTVSLSDNQKPDDEYAYKIDTGEYFKDAIDNIMKTWYYQWGFDRNGYPFLKRINVPITYVDDRTFTFGANWTSAIDIDAFKATYKYTTSITNCSADVTGSKFAVLFGTGPDCGNVQVYLRKGATAVRNKTFSTLQTSTSSFFYSGADPITAVNYTQLILATQVPYDTYKLAIVAPGTTKVKFDGVLCYHEGNDSPIERFYTGDVSTAGTVSSLDVTVNLDDQRTDCVVLGSRTGTRVSPDGEANYSEANPNNPIYTYVQSSARDINAIYKATASNYIGHPRMVLIQDPAIVSQDQADFVAFNVVNEYGTPSKQSQLTVAGHPKVQVGDCIAVFDNSKQIVSTTDYAWVVGINNQSEAGSYITEIETSPVQPVASYWEKTQPDLSNFNWNPIYNFKIYNGGGFGALAMDLSSTYEGANTKIRFSGVDTDQIPPKGFVKIGSEIIKYESVSTPGTTYTYNSKTVREIRTITRGLQVNGVSTSHSSANGFNDISLAYDPYIQESLGYAPIIQFDCLVNGEIEVAICNDGSNPFQGVPKFTGPDVRVDTLTGIGNEGYPYRGFDPITWGKNKTYLWGGFDQIGDYNNYGNGPNRETINKGYYCIEQYSLPPHKQFNTSMPYGAFYVLINIKPQDSTLNLSLPFQSRNRQVQSSAKFSYIYTRRGDPSVVDLVFSTSNIYMIKPYESVGHRGVWYRRAANDSFIVSSSVLAVATVPYTTYKDSLNANHQADTFFLNRSNDNNGLKFQFVHKNSDKYFDRTYFLNAGYKIYQFCMFVAPNPNTNETYHIFAYTNRVEGLLSDLYSEASFSTTAAFTFNVKNLIDKNPEFSFIPRKVKDNFIAFNLKDGKVPLDRAGNQLMVANVLFFTGNVKDLSGRTALNYHRYTPRYVPIELNKYANVLQRTAGPGSGSDGRYYKYTPAVPVIMSLGSVAPSGEKWQEIFRKTEDDSPILTSHDDSDLMLLIYKAQNNNNLPFSWSSTASATNRGGYEFVPSKVPDSWFLSFMQNYLNSNPSPWWPVLREIKIDKTLENEITFGRKNWIQWIDDSIVTRMVYLDMWGPHNKTIYINEDQNRDHSNQDYALLPNVWSYFYLSDFRTPGT